MQEFSTSMTVQVGNHEEVDVLVCASFSASQYTDMVEYWGAKVPHTYSEINEVKIESIEVDGEYYDDDDNVVFKDAQEIEIGDIHGDITDLVWDKIRAEGI